MGNLEDLATLAPFIAIAGIVSGALTFASKLIALWSKDESATNSKDKIAARLDLYSSAAVAVVGLAALIAVLSE